MYLHENDRIELEKQLENPRFSAMYERLIMLLPYKYKDLVLTQRIPLRANEINEGKIPERLVVINPGQDKNLIINMANRFFQELQSMALDLARYFPSSNRARWQEIFISLAITDQGYIKRNYGRPRGTGIYPTQAEFLEDVAQAVQECRFHKKRPTQENVIKYLPYGDKIELRTFQRWREQAGFKNFHELIQRIEKK